jgi:hypothetical protein
MTTRVGLGDPLQPRREVRRVADDAALLRLPRSERSPTTTIPVAIPTRTCSGEPADGDELRRGLDDREPGRTARSASCSWAWG